MRRSSIAPFALLVAVALPSHAQTRAGSPQKRVELPPPPTPPSAHLLAGITRRGLVLAEHDAVVRRAHGAMVPSEAGDTVALITVARNTARGWKVAVGELSPDHDSFLIAQLLTPGIQASHWAATVFDPPRSDTGYFVLAGRAVATSLEMFRPAVARPYTATVVPSEDGPGWWVYCYPSPATDGSWPRGGDMRFRVSADGRVITESRHLHEAIADYDAPEDTDVFHVIQRRPASPELMTAGRYLYRIDVDGRILLLGTR